MVEPGSPVIEAQLEDAYGGLWGSTSSDADPPSIVATPPGEDNYWLSVWLAEGETQGTVYTFTLDVGER